MDLIFHEKQEGSLCGQHCLNNLLQSSYFSPVDLAELAQQLDETERSHLDATQSQLVNSSHNMDDSGYFSIQVLQKALDIWNLCLCPYKSKKPEAVLARSNPLTQSAYICNFQDHWFAIRKLGHQWFNVNSMLPTPELISDTYISLFLAQLEQEGYSIFIVLGTLPSCDADAVLKLSPAIAIPKKSKAVKSDNNSPTEDNDLRKALEASRNLNEENDETLQQVLKLSMQEYENSTASGSNLGTCVPNNDTVELTHDELRRKRLEKLDKENVK